MLRKGSHRFCLGCAAALLAGATVVLYAFAVWFGNLNQDEGWYLYAAIRVAEGARPYRDFFFTQGPLLPYVYALFSGLWTPFGVLGGRILTALMGLAGCVMAAGLARRAVPAQRAAEAGLIAFGVTGSICSHLFHYDPQKPMRCSCLFWRNGVLSLCVSRRCKTRSALSCMWALPAGLLIAFAAGTRLSLGALLPVTALALLVTCRKTGAAFFWFALGGGVGLALVYGPCLMEAREAFIFGQTYHVSRGGRDWFYLAGSFSRTVRAYLPMALLTAALIIFRIFRSGIVGQNAQEEPAGVRYQGGMWPAIWTLGFLAVFLVHLFSPFPYDDYQVPVMGLLAAALAGWVANSTSSGTLRGCLCLFWTVASLLAAFASPLAQEWFVHGQDRFWVVRKPMPDLALLRLTARDVRALAEEDRLLLRQNTYLAVEAGMRVPDGLEMGPFSYFPELGDEDAQRFHVMNTRRLSELITSASCRVAAFSGYGLAVRAPVMDEVPHAERQMFFSKVGKYYDRVQEVPGFGQNGTTLQIWKRRTSAAEKAAE